MRIDLASVRFVQYSNVRACIFLGLIGPKEIMNLPDDTHAGPHIVQLQEVRVQGMLGLMRV